MLGSFSYLHCSITSVIFCCAVKGKGQKDSGLRWCFSLPSAVVIICNCSRKMFLNNRIFSYILTDTSTLQEVSVEKAHGVTIKYLPDVPSKTRCIQKHWDTLNMAVGLIINVHRVWPFFYILSVLCIMVYHRPQAHRHVQHIVTTTPPSHKSI